jgi:glutathione S-transferase
VDLVTGEHKKPDYKKLQPFGVVPAIDDDGYLLYGEFPGFPF